MYLRLELFQMRECCRALRFIPASARLACNVAHRGLFKNVVGREKLCKYVDGDYAVDNSGVFATKPEWWDADVPER